eukprot:EG_transcript_8300
MAQPDAKRPRPAEAPAAEARRLRESTQWAVINGLVMAVPGATQTVVTHCPYTLRPSPYPRRLFQQALELSQPFNRLVHAVSQDVAFLVDVHKEVVLVDDFTRHLVDILQAVHAEGVAQPRSLGIFRSDYMIDAAGHADCAEWRLRQVEINTIASSFAALSTKVGRLHRYLADRFEGGASEALPESTAGHLVPKALYEAYALNVAVPAEVKAARGVVLFVVQVGERNIADQKALDLALWQQGCLQSLWLSLQEIEELGTLDADRHLHINGKVVVVAYYRAGYTPRDYEAAEGPCWAARLKVERSTAIKCPSIGYHLAGTKKVQQALFDQQQLARFLSPADAALVSECFAPQYALSEDNDDVIQHAAENFRGFVLKPQREGGGNLVADEALQQMLQDITPEVRKAYVLMHRIRPPVLEGAIVRNGQLETGPLISELGIYGLCVGAGTELLYSECGGYLLRSKFERHADGGVAAGVACLDTPLLY